MASKKQKANRSEEEERPAKKVKSIEQLAEPDDFEEDEEDDMEEDEDHMDGVEGEGDESEYEEGEEMTLLPGMSVKNKSEYRAPTNDEIQQLKETKDMYKSNLFRMQLDELLKEVRVDYDRVADVESFLKTELGPALAQLEAKELTVTAKQFPYLAFHSTSSFPLKFQAPSRMDLIGSFLLHSLCKPELNIDVAMEIPRECFFGKDFLNHRYTDKRTAYVGVVYERLRKQHKDWSLSLTGFRDDPTKPIIVIRLPKVKRFVFRVIPFVSKQIFAAPDATAEEVVKSLKKLLPSRNNVRRADGEAAQPATPHYSNAILEDLMFKDHLSILHIRNGKCAAFKDAVLLFKVWLRQRGMHNRSDTFNGFLMSMLVEYLMQKRKLNHRMSAYQIFKITLEFICTHNFKSEPLFMPDHSDGVNDLPDLWANSELKKEDVFSNSFDVCFIDGSGVLNLTGRVSANAMAELQHEAKLAVSYLDNLNMDGFEPLFMRPVEFSEKFDNLLYLSTLPKPDLTHLPHQNILCNRAWYPHIVDSIMRLLAKALNNRVDLIRARTHKVGEWTAEHKRPPVQSTVTLGFLLNETHAYRLIDRGPAANAEEEALAFRKLWGQKSELRRFRDGSIVEAVVWEIARSQQHRLIQQIVVHLLSTHFPSTLATPVKPEPELESAKGSKNKKKQSKENIPAETKAGIRYIAGPLDFVLNVGAEGEDTDSSQLIWDAYNNLLKALKNLEDMPLEIRDIQPISAAFRYTDVYPPSVHPLAQTGTEVKKGEHVSQTANALCVRIQFESSSRWPDNLEAIQNLKTAFYLKMKEALENDHRTRSEVTEKFLDVFFRGFVFRLDIYHEREIHLVRKNPDVSAVRAFEREYLLRPLYSQRIHAFALEHLSYGPAVRLAKRWLAAHLFSGLIRDEAVELIMAAVFLSPQPFVAPHSAFIAFYRFLDLLVHFDWENNPLIVDLTGELTAEQLSAIQTRFDSVRSSHGGAALYISTAQDLHSEYWTGHHPSKITLQSIVNHAKRTRKVICEKLEFESSQGAVKSWKAVFETSFDKFDVLIKLKHSIIPHIKHGVNLLSPLSATDGKKQLQLSTFKNFREGPPLLVNFHVVDIYVKELRKRFGDIAHFYYDRYGGDFVAVSWRAPAFVPKPFQVGEAAYTVPSIDDDGKGTIMPNVIEILSVFRSIGEGVVEDVVVHSNPQ
eukprot:GILK01008100.1.p1 GENE.GILK01008100.1~~GILK01008100.1.p1  ORF type:complete len:1201 (+),score=282.77 GILK01008100.1:38-3604(+)